MKTRATLLVRLALRNLRRQARRSVLTAAAMVLGGAGLIMSVSLGDGTHEEWVESGVRMGSGHIALQAPGYQASKRIEDRLSIAEQRTVAAALEQPGIAEFIVSVAPNLTAEALASSPSGARPARVVGVDPVAEVEFSTLHDKVVEGRYLDPANRLEAYVGAGLAQGLKLKLGSRVVLTAQDAEGEITGQLVRVVGIFRSGIPEVDEAVIHVPLSTAGSWLHTGDDVTSIALLLDRSRAVPVVSLALGRELAAEIDGESITVLPWREAMPELDAAVRVDDLGLYLIEVILFGIIALAIVNTILMSVLSRHREFGVLQALGFTPGQTGGLVMIEGVILTTLSGFLGIAIGLFVTWFFWRDGLDISFAWKEDWSFSGVVLDPVFVPLFRTARVLQGLALILIVGTLASLYPAWRATRIEVAEAMKFE